jgi:DnaJ-class molecular chaperone
MKCNLCDGYGVFMRKKCPECGGARKNIKKIVHDEDQHGFFEETNQQ